jgi:Tol biopolymer transport system component
LRSPANTGTGSQLDTINPDGTDLFQLTNVNGAASSPDWSSDASRIVITPFADFPDNRSPDVGTIRPDGSDPRLLTKYTGGAVGAFAGSYSPDGRWITFRLQGPQTFGLWVMSADGVHRRLIGKFPCPKLI